VLREAPASYTNPQSQRREWNIEDLERVVAVQGDRVITEYGRVRTTYEGVAAAYAVGDTVRAGEIKHRTRRHQVAWSPFDQPGMEDD
jgi:hypothetical protein